MMEFDFGTITAGSLVLLYGLLFLSSFIDAIAGGGGLISLPAYLLTGLPAHYALGSNKLSASCGTLMATVNYMKSGALDWRMALVSAAFSFMGATCGSTAALHIDADLLKKVFIFALPVVAVIILSKRNLSDDNFSHTLDSKKRVLFAACIGLFIGFYDGMIGPGTGTFAIMAYCLLMKYDLRTASGNAKMLNLASNVASAITLAIAGTIVWKMAIPGAFFCILGGQTGSRLAIARGAKFIRTMLVVVLVMILVKLAWDVFM